MRTWGLKHTFLYGRINYGGDGQFLLVITGYHLFSFIIRNYEFYLHKFTGWGIKVLGKNPNILCGGGVKRQMFFFAECLNCFIKVIL